MRNSLLAMLIAFGTTVAMPANACCVQQKDAGKGVTTGIAGTTNAAPSETSDQYQKLMNAAKGTDVASWNRAGLIIGCSGACQKKKCTPDSGSV